MTIRITTSNNRLINGIISLCHAFGVNDIVVDGKKKQTRAIDEDAEDTEDIRIIAERANQPSRPFGEFETELRQKYLKEANGVSSN